MGNLPYQHSSALSYARAVHALRILLLFPNWLLLPQNYRPSQEGGRVPQRIRRRPSSLLAHPSALAEERLQVFCPYADYDGDCVVRALLSLMLNH